MSEWPFRNLPRGSAKVILVDPPWHFKRYSEAFSAASVGRAPQDHYDTMSLDEMKALPVRDLADSDCALFMWTTWPHLEQALELMRYWGWQYKTCGFDWMKADVSTIDLFPDPKDADMKMGYITRSNSEPCLYGSIGSPKRVDAGVRMGIIEPGREHSRKPSVTYERIERLFGDVPRVELFARHQRRGWLAWGNDKEKFTVA